MTLYELTGDWLTLMDMLEDPDADEQAIKDTLEGIEGAIEDKADRYAMIINNMKADGEKIRNEEKRLAARRRMLDDRADYLKRVLTEAMYTTGKIKFKTALYSFGIQKNPPSVVLDVALSEIPEEYLEFAEPTVNRKQMLVDIRHGRDLEGIAHIEQSESLRIR